MPIGSAWLSDLTWTRAANGDGPVEKDESMSRLPADTVPTAPHAVCLLAE
jgi:hypothetical protein